MQYPQRLHNSRNHAAFKDLSGWHDYVNAHFPMLELRSHSDVQFHASATSWHLGECSLTQLGTSACRVERTPALAQRANGGFLKVMWQIAGEMELVQDRREVLLQPGAASLCDTTRPYRIRMSEGSRLAVLLVPYDVDSRLPRYAERITATRLADTATMQAALGALTCLARAQPEPETAATGDVMQAVGSMLAASFARAAERDDADIDRQRLQRARHYIATHLASTDLTPARLANALCMSRRSLYALLARHELTPARLIAQTRLQHACKALESQRSITDIALAHGFSDSARFSRAFKARYGVPPSVWRDRHQGLLRFRASATCKTVNRVVQGASRRLWA